MMRHTPLDRPPCPVCEQPGQHNRRLLEHLGPWVCEGCPLFYYGTTGEWERYAEHRERRKQLREAAE